MITSFAPDLFERDQFDPSKGVEGQRLLSSRLSLVSAWVEPSEYLKSKLIYWLHKPNLSLSKTISVCLYSTPAILSAAKASVTSDRPQANRTTSEQLDKLNSLKSLKVNWDSRDSDPPTLDAIDKSKELLIKLADYGLHVGRVAPSVVGGVGLTIRSNSNESKKVYLEIRNDRQIVILFSGMNSDPKTAKFGFDDMSFGNKLEEIEVYLNG